MVYRIDNSSAIAVLPTPRAPGVSGFFTRGSPGSVPATIVDDDWLNMVQEELAAVPAAAGIGLAKGTNNQLLAAILALTRTKLFADTTLNVSPTGNDATGNGTTAAPFATMQRAFNYALAMFDMNGHALRIQAANGTYTAPVACSALPIGGGTVSFVGNPASPASCVVSVVGAPCFNATLKAAFTVSGFTLTASGAASDYTAGGVGLAASNGSAITWSNCIFGTAGFAHMYVTSGGTLSVPGPNYSYSITGGAQTHVIASSGGTVAVADSAITLVGTPAFSLAFAVASAGNVQIWGCTFSGTATGPRFSATYGGNVIVQGAGANYLPGSATGVQSLGGQYG